MRSPRCWFPAPDEEGRSPVIRPAAAGTHLLSGSHGRAEHSGAAVAAVRVVEPDAARAEVAEVHVGAGRDGDGDAAGAVGALDQLVRARLPAVEVSDRGDRAVVDIVG